MAMEWVKLTDNTVDKIKKDGRDPDASELLDLKAFVNSGEELIEEVMMACMYKIGDEFLVDGDTEVNFWNSPRFSC